MAARIAGVGRVTVSLRKSTMRSPFVAFSDSLGTLDSLSQQFDKYFV